MIIVIFVGGGCGGVVLITGSIFTHFAPVDAVPAYDWSLTQLVICCWGKLFWLIDDVGIGFGKSIGRWVVKVGEDGTILEDGGGDGYGFWTDEGETNG